MRATARFTYIAAGLFSLVCLAAPACTKSFSGPPRNRGVFYEQTDGKAVLLFRGTGTEMAPRAVPVTGTVRPTFLVDLPDPIDPRRTVKPEVRIAVALADYKDGPFKHVDATVTPIEGKPGAYQVRPTGDLPAGLSALVLGTDEALSADKDNVYPFSIVAAGPPG